MAEIIPFLGLIGVGYFIWQKFRAKATAPEAIVQTPQTVSTPIPSNPNASPVATPTAATEPVKPDDRLMTFGELLGWSKDDPELFKRMFPLTLPKQVRERFEGVSDEK